MDCVSCPLMCPPGGKAMLLVSSYFSSLESQSTWWEVISLHVLSRAWGAD